MSVNYPDSIRIGKKSSLDDRYGVWDSLTEVQRPYNSLAEANGAIGSHERHEGLTVLVKIGINQATEYWYQGGILDNHLVRKNNWIYLSAAADASYVLPAGSLISGIVLKAASNVPAFAIGTSPGGTEITGTTIPLTANVSLPLLNPIWADADTTLYFSGFSTVLVAITILKQ